MATAEVEGPTEVPRKLGRELALREVLRVLTGELELHTDSASVARMVAELDAALPESNWRERLAQSTTALGMAVAPARESLRELLAGADDHRPTVTCVFSDGGQERWIIVLGRRGGKLRVASILPSDVEILTIALDDLVVLLGIESEATPLDVMVVESALPLESIRSNNGHKRTPVSRLRSLAVIERRALMAMLVYAVVVGLLNLVAPLAVQTVVNTIAFGTLLQPLIVLTVLVLACLLLAGGLRVAEAIIAEFVQRRLFAITVADMANRLPRVCATIRHRYYTPELVNRFFDVITLQKSISGLMLDGLELALAVLVGMLVLGFYHPLLLAFDVILLLGLILTFAVGRGAINSSIDESDAKYEVVSWLEDVARNPTLFMSQRGAASALVQANKRALEYLEARASHFRILMRQVIGFVTLQAVASAALLGLGGWLVMDGQLTLGQLVAAELIVSTVVASLVKFAKHVESFYDMAAGVHKIGKVIDLPMERSRGRRLPRRPEAMTVHFDDLSLKSRVGSETLIRKATTTVEPGEKVGLMGAAGSGKSTVFEMLYGLHTPSEGRLDLDGVDIHTLERRSLRDQVVLLAEHEVINGTLEENLLIGAPVASPLELQEAIDKVGLNDAIARLPLGLQTPLTAEGRPLSRAVLTRLMVARAILMKPRLLLVDGLLDDLEYDVRQDLIAPLFAEKAGWTLIIATTRPDVLRRCDRRVRLTDGTLQE